MKKSYILTLLFLVSLKMVNAQIPVETYRMEISNLKTKEDIQAYWKQLEDIDQNILVPMTNTHEGDSLSIDNMVRTALMFEIHGERVYAPDIAVPIVNMSHNRNGYSQIVFWNIIQKCKKVGGLIDTFGGKFPAYQLEGLSLTFYEYSLFNQDERYPHLEKRLDSLTTDKVPENLLYAYDYQKKTYQLKEKKVLGEWYVQSSVNLIDDDTFSFVLMSDKNLYLKTGIRYQKLILVKAKGKNRIYKIEHEPFGWTYVYGKDGSLSLLDENKEVLISYTPAKDK